MRFSKDDCIKALKEASRELGKSPSIREYDELGNSPSSHTISERFGSWNKAKQEAKLESFEFDNEISAKPDGVELPSDKAWEELTPYQRYYYKNRSEEISRTTNRKEKINQWFKQYKDSLKCEKCGENHNACLEFHHKGEKTSSVSKMVKNSTSSKKRILEEIEKCRVLCANCHRKIHS